MDSGCQSFQNIIGLCVLTNYILVIGGMSRLSRLYTDNGRRNVKIKLEFWKQNLQILLIRSLAHLSASLHHFTESLLYFVKTVWPAYQQIMMMMITIMNHDHQEGQIMAGVPTDATEVGKQILPISSGATFHLKKLATSKSLLFSFITKFQQKSL